MRLLESPWLSAELQQVETHIRAAAKSRELVLRKSTLELAAAGGKRLRPALVLIGSQYGQNRDEVIPQIAAAVELLHMATLVHDDIIDDSPTRRGFPTVQARYGKEVAVFAGDFLLTKALLLLATARADDRMLDLAKTMVHICEGEVGQFATRFQRVSVLKYLKRIHGKTAALFGLSAAAGAKQAGAPEAVANALARYGLYFGMAFQIYDDLLDYTSDNRLIGKPITQDLQSGIYTLPLLLALRDRTVGSRLNQILSIGLDHTSIGQVLSLVQETNALQGCQQTMAKYVHKAKAELVHLPAGEITDVLEQLPDSLFEI